MRALLLGSPDVQPDFDFMARIPNLGIVSIAGNTDYDVDVADLILKRGRHEKYVKKIANRYDLVGFSCMSFQYPGAKNLMRIVKDAGAEVVVGGYHATLLYEDIAKEDADLVDYIVRGEGEATFHELMEALDGRRDLESVKGLSYKTLEGFKHNPPRDLLDLSTIKLPDRDARLLKRGFHGIGRPSDVVETSRGCVQGCKFCSINHMYGKTFRKYEIDRVLADIQDAVDHGANSVLFVDDNITLDVKRLEAICDAIIDAGLDHIHYTTQASTSGIARADVDKMARAGFKGVFLGIESTDPQRLAWFNKGNMSEDSEIAVKKMKDAGMIVSGGLIQGSPDDDVEAIWRSYEFAHRLKIDYPIFFITTPYPRTQLREELLEMGLVANPDDYSRYNGIYANVHTKHLTVDELQYEVWKMASKYYDFNWIKWNNVKKIYPVWFWRKFVAVSCRFIWRRILRNLGLRDLMDFYEEDMRTGLLYFGY